MEQQAEEESCVPPGFRFHPTEEELVGYYLARKVASQKIDLDIIREVDLYRIEPWDLQERCKCGHEEQSEWYFFSYKDRKYPSGTRTNRATAAGFWKATGRDKPVLSRSTVIGMRKTLVFYKGRAPSGSKTDWIIHEYRLQSQTNEQPPAQEEGWVVCRAFQKPVPSPNQRPFFPSYAAPAGYYDVANARLHHHFLGSHPNHTAGSGCFPQQYYYSSDLQDFESKKQLLSIPLPEISPTTIGLGCAEAGYIAQRSDNGDHEGQPAAGAIDWNFLGTLLSTSQLHEYSSTSSLQ